MSVPAWRRKESHTEYIRNLYNINVRIGTALAKMPSKYRMNYGDQLIALSTEALIAADRANGIYMRESTSPEDKARRKELLMLAGRNCRDIPVVAEILYGIVECVDGKLKSTKDLEFIATTCGATAKMIAGVIESDKRYN